MRQPIFSEKLADAIDEADELFIRVASVSDFNGDSFGLYDGLDIWAIVACPLVTERPAPRVWFYATEAEARAKFDKLTGGLAVKSAARSEAPPLTYKTGHFTAEQKQAAEVNAEAQEAIIMALFMDDPGLKAGASEIWLAGFRDTTPLTSVRRALTNLKKKGFMRQTDQTTIGYFDRNERVWARAF